MRALRVACTLRSSKGLGSMLWIFFHAVLFVIEINSYPLRLERKKDKAFLVGGQSLSFDKATVVLCDGSVFLCDR